jgi:multisubunit Na+/H+ antiporter MnhE subunit
MLRGWWWGSIIVLRSAFIIVWLSVLVFELAKAALHSLNIVVQLRRSIHIMVVAVDTISMNESTLRLVFVAIKAHRCQWPASVALWSLFV